MKVGEVGMSQLYVYTLNGLRYADKKGSVHIKQKKTKYFALHFSFLLIDRR